MQDDTAPRPRSQTAAAPPPLSYSVDAAMKATGLGRSTIYELMAEGRLQRVKVGKRTLIPHASLEALILGKAA